MLYTRLNCIHMYIHAQADADPYIYIVRREKQGRAHKRCTPVDPHIWMCKSRTTSTNLHTATM